MEISLVKYLGNLRTEAVHLRSGNKIITDAPPDNNGKGEFFSPTDILSTSLACCMMTLMGIAAQTHSIKLEHMDARVTKIMASGPRRVAEIKIEFNLQHNRFNSKEKTILERAALTCPVALSLHPDVKQNISFTY